MSTTMNVLIRWHLTTSTLQGFAFLRAVQLLLTTYNWFIVCSIRLPRHGPGTTVSGICNMSHVFFVFLTSHELYPWIMNQCTPQYFLSYPIVSLYIIVSSCWPPILTPSLFTTEGWWSPSHGQLVLPLRGPLRQVEERSEGGALEGSWKQLATWLGSAGNAEVRNLTMAIMGISWEITCKTHFYRKNSDGQISQVFRTKATQGQHTADPTFVGVSVQPHRVVSMTNGMPVRRSDIPMTRCDESISALLPLQRHCQILSAD